MSPWPPPDTSEERAIQEWEASVNTFGEISEALGRAATDLATMSRDLADSLPAARNGLATSLRRLADEIEDKVFESRDDLELTAEALTQLRALLHEPPDRARRT